MSRKKYVIIGDGAAGITAASYIRQGDPHSDIQILSDDPNPAYFRAALTNYLIGELRDDQIWAVPPDFYTEFNIQRTLARVLEVDPANARLRLANGTSEAYDQLLIATGSRPNTLDVEGVHLPGVMTMRTLQDVRQVLDWVSVHHLRQAVIVGGGPLAMEWAQGLGERGVQVTMVIRDDHLMRRELDAVASDLVEARLRLHGIRLLMNEEVAAVTAGTDGYVSAVQLKSGRSLPCDLLGLAIGVRCNTEFLKGGAVALAGNGAVVVDIHQRTSVELIYAAGDVAQVNGVQVQLWEPSRWQGRTAAYHMTGREAATDLTSHYFATRLYDLDFALVSRPAGPRINGREALGRPGVEANETLLDFPKGTGRMAYRKLELAEGRLVSALLLGERKEKIRARGRLYQRLVKEQIDVSPIRDWLLDPDFDLARWLNAQQLAAGADAREAPFGAGPAPVGVPPSADLRRAQAVTGSLLIGVEEPVPAGVEGKTITSVGLSTGQLAIDARPAETGPALAALELDGRRWVLNSVVTFIGRAPDATISLSDPGVSVMHAQLTRQGDKFFLRDLGSRNGTWVNDRQASVPVVLRDGDEIGLGSLQLRFRAPGGRIPLAADSVVDKPTGVRLAMLVGRAGSVLGLEFELAESPITVGRDGGCDIQLHDPTVSRWHAWFTQESGRWSVADTGSANGTRVNGKQLEPNARCPLNDGDQIEFGTLRMQYRHWRGEG